ncbi:endonuclease/exonuclease/phosphatase family protein [Saccharothrix sp. S26]|uniref:endonuclease/exonuclease/phosphatase family protein n=1 Tax=Saccharothrix sp. S26 TaxID=2907215 RepID=UPI001F393BB9|nr:endonuclease/exonuclease/phosphatase family protein [Saccharothrix sp. S26]MCE6993273.1 endonuclease/exonuclease/phosphatase family protein [Saccharothrix sp. S26]
MPLSLLTLNLGAPSLDRARRQLAWLADRPEDVFVLTETKATPGTKHLADTFTAAGYAVTLPHHADGELGVLIVSKTATRPDPLTDHLDYLPARATGVVTHTDHGPLRILGAYVPSRDATLDKTERKKRWIAGFQAALDTTRTDTPVLLLGDLNVIEPDHQPPHRGQFAPFEYDFYRDLTRRHGLLDLYRHHHPDRIDHSWARRPELGYRYDHAHATPDLADQLLTCAYVHDTRTPQADGTRLTDHSGLAVTLNLTPATRLLTSDPTTVATQHDEPEFTLF